jgi:serine/threonine-protein kinase
MAVLAPVNDSTGAAWAPDGTIVFAPGYSSGLARVSADGGAIQPLTTRQTAAGEAGHSWPDVLPDGDHVLYTIEYSGKPFDEADIGVVSLSTGATKLVLKGGSVARYSSTGHLVYARAGRLLAVPFDPVKLEVTGETTTVASGVSSEIGRGRTHFAVSRVGSLAFVPEISTSAPGTCCGSHAMARSHRQRGSAAASPACFNDRVPVVSPDGRWLAYASDETGRSEIYVQPFPGPGPKRQVSEGSGVDLTTPLGGSDPDRTLRWSHDGRELSYWDGDRLLSVPVGANREFSSGSPRAVFELAGVLDADVAPDGQRFLVAREMAAARLGQIVVALGGAASIGTRTP